MLPLSRNRRQMYVWCWLVILAMTFSLSQATGLLLTESAVWAQDPKEEPVDDGGGEEQPAAEEAAPAAAPAPGKSYLMWIITASGPFGAMIALESFLLVAMIAMNMMQFRREMFMPAALIETFEQKVGAKDYQGAYEAAKASDSYLGKLLASGMARLSKGFEEAQAGMNEAADDEAMALDHKLSYTGLIVATAPMLGLLGTVQGMIDSFRVIAESETSPKPKELAEGIMTALVTTMEGLVVAIPAIFAFGLFKNKLARLQYDVSLVAEGLMSRFAGLGTAAKKPAAPAAVAGAAPTAPPAAG